MADPRLVDLLDSGTRRLVRSVDALADDAWTEPSLLPGWSRAHVVAHLTLNAVGLAGALDGVREGRPVPMYASDEARDGGIEELSGAEPADLRARFLASTTRVAEAVGELRDELAQTAVERTPGGRRFRAGDVGWMRLREVEIHHADLGLDQTAADWPLAVVVHVLDWRSSTYPDVPGFAAHATDLDRAWTFGTGGPTVSGTGAALAWWVTGRPRDQVPGGDALTSDDGPVPRTEPW